MATSVVGKILFRGLLPLILFGATIVRFSGISLTYGLLLLISPLLASPSSESMSSHTGRYLISVVVFSTLALLAQVVFQGFLLAKDTDLSSYGDILQNCSTLEKTLRQVGLQRLEPNDVLNIIRVVVPDITMFIVSLIVLIACKKLCREAPAPLIGEQREIQPTRKKTSKRRSQVVQLLGEFFVVTFLAMSGIAYPSVLSAIYFLTFLVTATWWACYKTLGQKFAYLRIALLMYSGSHLLLIYLYQFQFFQEALDPSTLIARLLGLTGIIETDCDKPWVITFGRNVKWTMFASPACILLLYFALACEMRRWRRKKEEARLHASRTGSPSKAGGPKRGRKNRGPANSERQVLNDQVDESSVQCVPDTQSLVDEIEEHHTYDSMAPLDSPSSAERPQHQLSMMSESEAIGPKQRSAMASIFAYVMKQSYATALIIMMAWSITYHSWLTFVYLLAACVIWMTPQKRQVALVASPIIVFYAEGLLLMQYIYGLNLPELPQKTESGYQYKEIGLVKYDFPCIPLAIQIGFTGFFWMTLRQYMRELHLKRQEPNIGGVPLEAVRDPSGPDQAGCVVPAITRSQVTGDQYQSGSVLARISAPGTTDIVEGYDGDTIKAIGRWLWTCMCKYWILVCASLFLVMAVQEAVIYRVIYMVLFLYFVLTFKIVYSFWRFSVVVFWWFVIVYSMVVLCLIYTYQFENFPEYWKNNTGLSDETLADLGLEQFDTATLFVKLLTPTSFLVVIILQLHYFQKPFLKLSDIRRYSVTELNINDMNQSDGEGGATSDVDGSQVGDAGSVTSRESHAKHNKKWHGKLFLLLCRLWQAGSALLGRFSDLLWRILEVHFIKAVFFTIFISTVMEVSAINVVFVVLLMIGAPIPQLHKFTSHACLVWCGIVILAKMLFQLQTIKKADDVWNTTCISPNNSLPQIPTDNAHYIGLDRSDNLAYYIRNYIAILVVLAVEGIIWVHQAQHYSRPGVAKPKTGIIFPDIKRPDADHSLLQFTKFLANYCFYKFGLELCFIMTVITMVVRLDAYSLVYGLLLGLLLCMSRRACFICWPIYIIVLAVLLFVQYMAVLGAPPVLCWIYPWSSAGVLHLAENLKIFLYLPSYINSPDAIKLIADFFQLGFVCLQWRVFYLENSSDVEEYGGGDNKDIVEDVEAGRENPVEDFLSCKDSYLDYLKTGVFMYMFWVTLVIVFITGTTRISLFCMGYLMGVFFFLWFGQEMLIKPLRKLLRLWGILLGYNYFVLMCKCALQLVGCVYLSALVKDFCWLVQLLSIVCIRAGQYDSTQIPKSKGGESCAIKEDEAGLIWDSVCFVFLLMQLRIYRSHYFRHVVTELHIHNKLAARGAELINMNLLKSVRERKEREDMVLTKIKQKMERLKLRQERLAQKRPLFTSDDHYVVIRSGDYYMFDDDSDDDAESSLEPDTLTLGTMQIDETDSRLGPLEILNTALSGGPKEAMQMVKRRSRTDSISESLSRQTSMVDSSDLSPTERRSRMLRNAALRDSIMEEGDPTITSPSSEGTYDTPTASPGDASAGPSSPVDMPTTGVMDSSVGIQTHSLEPTAEKGETPEEGEPDSDFEEIEEPLAESCCQRFVSSMKLAWAVIASILDYLIGVLNNFSQEYRNTARLLDREKELEKQRLKERSGRRSKKEGTDRDTREITLQLISTDMDEVEGEPDPEMEFRDSTPRIFQLLIALFDVVISRSDLLCYFAMILNHMVSASILSLVYPILVFLWALLSVPRPTKTYWVTMITYTEAVVVVKYLFQFGFFPWNNESSVTTLSDPFFPPRIIGIERKDNYAAFDLFLLVCLFIHRSVLKRNGLWKDSAEFEEDLQQAGEKVASPTSSPVNTPLNVPVRIVITDYDSRNGKTMGSPAKQSEVSGGMLEGEGQENLALELTSSSNEAQPDDDCQDDDDSEDERPHKGQVGACYTCCVPFRNFYHQMTNPIFNAATDVYALMFLCDFINFFIIVFGYKSFGPGSGNTESGATVVAAVIQENKVPIPFLVMLLSQFVLIIIDRAIYLRKQVVSKFVYQIFLVALIHVWMFFILPAITLRSFSANVPAQLWYFVKCIYFGLSAYQIRSGYPTRILGNFLTKKFDYTNLFLFKGFLAIPFLLELRALMDWMWTDTTLALTSWLEMEDIYANIFQLKCWRKAEDAYPTQRGQLRKLAVKYGVGGLLLFLLIFIIWFPLLLFSLADTVLYEPNLPVDCVVQIKLGGYQPIFHMSAQQQFLTPLSDHDYGRLNNLFSGRPDAIAVLEQYKASDITRVTINGESTALWGISPPSQKALQNDLLNKSSAVDLFFTITFQRDPKPGLNTDSVSMQLKYVLDPNNSTTWQIRKDFASAINGTATQVVVKGLFPRYLRVPASESPAALRPLNDGVQTNVSFRLQQEKLNKDQQWWELNETTSSKIFESPSDLVEENNYLTILAFNDRVAPAGLSFFTGYGIIGLYVSLVLVIGRFVRLFFSGLSSQIMFQELPNVDKVLKLCLDLYMVREAGELKMEEELFAKLLFLYRSPQTLIRITKHKVS